MIKVLFLASKAPGPMKVGLPRGATTLKLVAGVVKQIGKTREIEVKKCAIRAEEMRKQAVYFWKKWKAERIKKNNVES